jgi:DNA processing protein
MPAQPPSPASVNKLTPEWRAWLRLMHTPGVGRSTARELLARLGSPAGLFDGATQAAMAEAVAQGAIPASLLHALRTPPDGFDALCARVATWLDGAPTRTLIPMDDARYSPALLQTADPPLLLYAQGCTALLQTPSVAVVGSRNATAQGLDNAREFARVLSERGYTVVSGMALGIDGAAHAGALLGPSSTVAVIGTGIDRIYPSRHEALARQIADQGLIVSEWPLGAPPLAEHFPQRNRIIAGLSLGTLVVEAALKSGSLITAQLALECGREVFAMPGSIHAPQSHGCHALLKQGAKLVERAQDVIEELQRSDGQVSLGRMPAAEAIHAEADDAGSHPARSSNDQAVLDALGFDPVTLDTVLDRTGLDAASAQARLLELELQGLVQRLGGGRFARQGLG